MGSSRVRRQARHLFLSALQGARTTRWRSAGPRGFCWGIPLASEKASNTAEKSGGSKPRRLRGLRRGKRRSRECHSRRTVDRRQPQSHETTRPMKKWASQFDYWERWVDLLVRRMRPFVERSFLTGQIDPRTGKAIRDWESYTKFRGQHRRLQRHIARAHLGARYKFAWNWRDFLYNSFGFSVLEGDWENGSGNYRSQLSDLLVGLVRPSFKTALEEKQTSKSRLQRRHALRRTSKRDVTTPRKGVALCSGCGSALGSAHASPSCPVRLANRAKRGSPLP